MIFFLLIRLQMYGKFKNGIKQLKYLIDIDSKRVIYEVNYNHLLEINVVVKFILLRCSKSTLSKRKEQPN